MDEPSEPQIPIFGAPLPAPEPIEPPTETETQVHPGEVVLLFAVILALLFGWWYVQQPRRTARDDGMSDLIQAETTARYALSGSGSMGVFSGGGGRLSPWKQTEAAYRRALKVNPALPRARRGLAATLYEMGDKVGAAKVMDEDAHLPPKDEEVWKAAQTAFGALPRPTDPARLARYQAALQRKDLGWSRYVALEALSTSPKEAAQWDRRMRKEYGRDPMVMVILMAVLIFILLPAGIGILGWFISHGPFDQLQRLTVPRAALLYAFFIGFVVYQVPSVLLGLLGGHGKGSMDAIGLQWTVAAMVVGGALLYLAATFILRNAGGGLGQLGWRARDAIVWAIGGHLALIPPILATIALVSLLSNVFPKVQTPSNPAAGMAAGASGWQIALVIVLASVVAPITEELLFRGLLFRALTERYGVVVGALASTLVFAGLHPQLPLGFPPLFAIGLGLCILYRASGSLVPGMILHGVNNAVALVLVRVLIGHVR